MDKKLLILIFVLTLVPFILYVNTDSFVDGDSYYYLNAVCNQGENTSSSYIFWFITDILPCNFFVIKIIYWFLYFSSVLVLTEFVSLFSKNYVYTPFLVSATFFVFEFMKFENDAFSFLLGFVGLYIYFKNKGLSKYYSLVPLAIAFLFWEGAGYWLLAMPIVFILFSLLLPNRVFWFLMNIDPSIIEHTPWIGFMNYALIIPLFYIGFLNTKNIKIKVCFVLLAAINIFISKLWILALPFGLVIAANAIGFLKDNWNLQIKNYIIIAGVIFCLFSSYHILSQPFTEQDVALIKEGVALACEKNNCMIENNFSAGHTIIFYGGQTKQKAGTSSFVYENIVIDINSTKNKAPNNCEKIRETKYFRLFDCHQ